MAARKPASLKVRALQWLAQREYSRTELRERLLRLAASAMRGQDDTAPRGEAATQSALEAEVDTVLDWLAEHRYLSDARFVDSRLNARRSRYGNLRIERELGRHDLALAPEQASDLRASEYERAQAVWQRKFGAAPAAADAGARLRQMRFLAGRGFTPEVIRRVLRAANAGNEPTDAADAPD